MKKTIEMIKQNTYEMKNDRNTIAEALISSRETEFKEEPIQRMDKFNSRPRTKFNNNRPCRFCNELESNTQMPSTRPDMQQLRKEGPFCTDMQTRRKL